MLRRERDVTHMHVVSANAGISAFAIEDHVRPSDRVSTPSWMLDVAGIVQTVMQRQSVARRSTKCWQIEVLIQSFSPQLLSLAIHSNLVVTLLPYKLFFSSHSVVTIKMLLVSLKYQRRSHKQELGYCYHFNRYRAFIYALDIHISRSHLLSFCALLIVIWRVNSSIRSAFFFNHTLWCT